MIRLTPLTVASTLALALSLGSAAAHAQSAENVVVVVNDASPESQRIAEHYVRVRAIPASNVFHIRTVTEETIDRDAYIKTIATPIAAALRRNALQDRVLYIVLTKGIPLRVEGTDGRNGTVASVDSELTLLYREMTGATVSLLARVDNPYYLATSAISAAQRFTHRAHDIYLVSRLDAFTADEAIALIDRGLKPARDGTIVLDQRRGVHRDQSGDAWLAEAAKRVSDLGFANRVVLEQTTELAPATSDVLGYYSWGSNDPKVRSRRSGMRFVPGALAATFVSTDARTFQNPPEKWSPGDEWNSSMSFAGSPQSLVGDLIRDGATGVAGHVAEPYLNSTVRPEILFSAYLSGFSVVEAFYLAIPHLSWQTVVIGDPLCAPFSKRMLTRAEIEDAIDATTELPGLYSARRIAHVRASAKDAPADALPLIVRTEERLAVGDIASGIELLEQLAAKAPAFVNPQLRLASLYVLRGQRSQANDRYRAVLKVDPDNAIALNDLAYSLAGDQTTLSDALALAKRAAALAPKSASVLDTLGWIEYLSGNGATALTLLGQAVKLAPANAEIRLHAAIAYGAAGNRSAAEAELKEALRLNPALEKRDEVVTLRRRLAQP